MATQSPTEAGALDAAMQQKFDARPEKIWSGAGDLPPDEVHVYRRGDHWLYVTWGLSSLWANEPDGGDTEEASEEPPAVELTLRVRADGDQDAPPEWPVSLLENLCRYVATTGHALDVGHSMHLRGPLALERDTQLCALAFVDDPELHTLVFEALEAPVEFVQAVALTDDEYRAARRWNVERVTALLAGANPLGVVDLARTSRLADARLKSAVDAGAQKEGSSTGELFIPEADWRRGGDGVPRIKIGAGSALTLAELLAARLPFGRPLLVVSARSGKRARILFEPGKVAATDEITDGLRIVLPTVALAAWTAILRPARGRHELTTPPCTVEIVRSEIRDRDGRVVEVIE